MPKCLKQDRWVPPFIGWVPYNATIPKMYWDTYSQEQRIHAMCDMMHKLACYADMLGVNIGIDHKAIEKLESEFLQFKAHGFEDYYERQLQAWIDAHANIIYERFAHGVYFGLTMEGRFVAYIPESWDEISFDTGAVWGNEDYGRLILRYDVDSPYTVEQP